MRLIGISGLKTSGKDTTYKVIEGLLPDVQRAAFADKLKLAAAIVLGHQEEDFFDEDPPKTLIEYMDDFKNEGLVQYGIHDLYDISGREYLQHFGQGLRGVFGDTFWIDQVLPEPRDTFDNMAEEARTAYEEESFFRTHYPNAAVVVVTDVRYPNEAQRVRDLGGEIWEVIRPGLASDGHSSEIPLPRELVDRQIDNSGDIYDLETRVEEALTEVGAAIIRV